MFNRATATVRPGTADSGEDRTVLERESGHDVRRLETVRSVDADAWNDVVERSACGTVFHRYEWIAAVERGLSYPGAHLVVEKDTNLIGICPQFEVPFPRTPVTRLTSIYPGFGGPLFTTDVSEGMEVLFDAVPKVTTARTAVHELRVCNTNALRYHEFLRERGYRPVQNGGRFRLQLDRGFDDLLDQMSSSRRRRIRRAGDADTQVVEEEVTVRSLRRIFTAYERHMSRVGGEVFPRAFFEALSDMAARIVLVTARVEDEYAGGFVELLDDEQDSVHGFFACVPEEYYANNVSELLYEYVIRWAADNGYRYYDFGGSGADFRDGAFSFKESFGGELIPNLYWERGTSPLWPILRAGRAAYWRYGD